MANQLIASTEIVFNAMSLLTVDKTYIMTLDSIDNTQVSRNQRTLSFGLGKVKHLGKDIPVRCLIMKRTPDETPTFEEGGTYPITPTKNGTWTNAVLLTPQK